MRHSITAALLLVTVLLGAGAAMACEKHLNGHQTGSDTNAEALQK
jgi:hypothetical protein